MHKRSKEVIPLFVNSLAETSVSPSLIKASFCRFIAATIFSACCCAAFTFKGGGGGMMGSALGLIVAFIVKYTLCIKDV